MKLNPEQQAAVSARAQQLTIRAGAGAGKTLVLVERYLSHVLNDGAQPGEILAITFTKKAAAEMKTRIVRRLREEGRREEARQAQIGPISTVHGYCERLLREYPFAAGVDPMFEVLSEHRSRELIAECARKALRNRNALGEAELALIKATGGETFYNAPANEMAARLHQWLQDLIEKFRIAGRAPSDLERLADSAQSVLCSWNAYVEQMAEAQLGQPLPEGWRREPDILKRFKSRPPWLKSPMADEESEEAAAVLAQGLSTLGARAWRMLLAEFEKRRVLDFSELEARTCYLLENKPETIAGKYRWLMADEAQDLNPVQYRILNATPVEYRLFVGDPQQSIYGFRGAERRHFIDTLDHSERCHLATNWRSRKIVLRCVEAIFHNTWKEDFHRMESGMLDGEDPFEGEAELWKVPDKGSEAAVAEGVKGLIREGTRAGRITILVNSSMSVDSLVAPLAEAGIRVAVAGAGRNYFLRTEIRDIGSALQALVNPGDDLAMLALLRSPLVGVSLDGVLRLGIIAKSSGTRVCDLLSNALLKAPDVEQISAFTRWFWQLSERVDRLSAWEAISELYTATKLDARFTFMSAAQQLIANARKLLSLAIERKEMSASQFAEWLATQQTIRSRAGDAGNVTEEEDAVCISTMHSAKGLEWDVVVVQAIPMKSRRRNLVVEPDAGILAIRSGEYEPLAFRAAEAARVNKEIEEQRRLLYVSMTRAKEKVCVAITGGRNQWTADVLNCLAPRWQAPDWLRFRDLTPASPGPQPLE